MHFRNQPTSTLPLVAGLPTADRRKRPYGTNAAASQPKNNYFCTVNKRVLSGVLDEGGPLRAGDWPRCSWEPALFGNLVVNKAVPGFQKLGPRDGQGTARKMGSGGGRVCKGRPKKDYIRRGLGCIKICGVYQTCDADSLQNICSHNEFRREASP